jgi:glycosyltransferase involved in cell wall biosynthesis
MSTPTVSVVVPTRDRTALLAEALASIRAVEGPDLRLEIVVGDNSPTGSAEPIARRFSAVYRRASQSGAGAARNAALNAASGEFIAFLDDDDLWLPSHIRPLLRLLAARPDYGAAIGQVVNTDASGGSRGAAWPPGLSRDGDVRSEFFTFHPQLGATVVRAEVARAVGLFDPQLVGDQDWDWHLRLAARTRIGFVAEPLILFRQRAVGADTRLMWTRLDFSTRVMWRNALRMPTALRLSTLRAFVADRGLFSYNFRVAAKAHAESGELSLARAALTYSFFASPAHFLASLARDGWTVPVLLWAITRRQA